ncbi:SurA N-terminal domain-containing protein [Shewanella gelidii]|uniref:Periplasmic chaperone PpiD n=1 Tax=Shewanella gelidii TaxID=1642821 RepID=A0A917N7K5_9GAMM|nr:SurA N-terminal domain-containing protein [Shewanella gelidii]MCL1097445.1 SurA N-terminal domain-containing protein [Shewanella gelidii]GGI75248.1 peptidylprolyl isomerase [Shewanella gelidii]
MLEKIREGSQGVVAKSILVLVIFSFAFAGVSSYLGSSTETPAARVNGEDISQSALEQAYQNERSRMEQQLGEMFEALAANDVYLQSIKQRVLDRLVAERLVDQAANKLGLRVSDEQIKQAIVNETAFHTDGVFDNERYQAVIRQVGYTTTSFRDMMRVDMTRRQLLAAVIGTEFVLEGEAKQYAEVEGQTRDIRYQIIEAQPFLADVVVSDEEANAFYEQNLAQFMSQELVSVEYIELNAAKLAQSVTVSEEEVLAEYEAQKSLYQTAEKRLAAHILVEDADQANKIHARLIAGETFEALAKAESSDAFSGEQGGKLDWFEPGVMEAEFDTALFALEKGAFSNVVKTNFGYHIVKLLDIQPGAAAPFEEVKDKVTEQLKMNLAADEFYSLQQKLADTSYEVPDTLSEAATEIGAKVLSTDLFSRNNAPALFNADAVKAAFSSEVVVEGMNSDVIELGDNHVLVLRVKEHQAAGTRDFADVKADIVARLQQEKANEQARDQAQLAMTQVKDGASTAEFKTVSKLSRMTNELNASIVGKAFEMPLAAEGASVDTVGLANGYAVVVLDKVNAAESIAEEAVAAITQRLNSQYSEADYQSLVASLKASSEVLYPVAE